MVLKPHYSRYNCLLVSSIPKFEARKEVEGESYMKVRASLMAQQVKNLPAMQEKHKKHRFELWVGKIPCRRKWQPTLAFLSVKSHGQRSLASYNS